MSIIKSKSAKKRLLMTTKIHVTVSNDSLNVSNEGTSFGIPLTNTNSYVPVVVR